MQYYFFMEVYAEKTWKYKSAKMLLQAERAKWTLTFLSTTLLSAKKEWIVKTVSQNDSFEGVA